MAMLLFISSLSLSVLEGDNFQAIEDGRSET